jgi:hypothetical protein
MAAALATTATTATTTGCMEDGSTTVCRAITQRRVPQLLLLLLAVSVAWLVPVETMVGWMRASNQMAKKVGTRGLRHGGRSE